jgi:hypothetical protein
MRGVKIHENLLTPLFGVPCMVNNLVVQVHYGGL